MQWMPFYFIFLIKFFKVTTHIMYMYGNWTCSWRLHVHVVCTFLEYLHSSHTYNQMCIEIDMLFWNYIQLCYMTLMCCWQTIVAGASLSSPILWSEDFHCSYWSDLLNCWRARLQHVSHDKVTVERWVRCNFPRERELGNSKKINNYGKFHNASGQPPLLWKKNFFSETSPFFETFL